MASRDGGTTREDPRVGRTRERVVAATIELIAQEGPAAVSFQSVARAAGVGRATLYRHWPQPEDLVFEALAQIVSAWDFSGPGRFEDAVVAEIVRHRSELNQPVVRTAFTSVLSRAGHDPRAAAIRDRLVHSIAGGLRESLRAAQERGEVRPGLDAEVLTAQVMGAMVWRSFVLGENVTAAFVERVVGEALRGWEAA